MDNIRKEEREALEVIYGEDAPVSVEFSEDNAHVSLRIDVPLGRFTLIAINENGGLIFFRMLFCNLSTYRQVDD